LASLLDREGVTILNQTPSAFRSLLQVFGEHANGAGYSATTLRYVIFGGEALEPATVERWYDVFGQEDRRLVNMYGITETTVHVTYRPMGYLDVRDRRGSMVGRPITDLQIHLLGRSMHPVPVGIPGEIYVGGEGLAR